MARDQLDYSRFEALTFDCYGTLIDWETGILRGLRATLDRHGIDAPDDELLELYATAEEFAESGNAGHSATEPPNAATSSAVGTWPK